MPLDSFHGPSAVTQQEASQGLSHSLPSHHTQGFPPGLGRLLIAGGVSLQYLGLISLTQLSI